MSFFNFLKDKFLYILLLIFVIFTIEVFLLVFEISLFFRVYIAVSLILTYFLILFLEYHKKKSFYDNLYKNLDKLDEKYLITEISQSPDFLEGQILIDVLRDINKSMTENVNKYKYLQQDYKEYIQLWIHDIKIPISAGKMVIENNKNKVTLSIEEELDKIEDYVEQVLYYARSNDVYKDYIVKKTNLKDVVNFVIKKNKKDFITNKIKLELKDLDIVVRTDSKWLTYTLNQIIVNSIKYRNNENPEIKVYTKNNKDSVSIIIYDNGIGIAKNDLNRVFDKGFTGDNGRKYEKSTGMGLYLVKRLLLKLGYDIKITSKKDEYTCVEIVIPNNSFISDVM